MKATNLSQRLKELDSFAAPVPGFNIRGQDKVATNIGVCMTLFKLFVTSVFALLKFSHLMRQHNPTVNTYTENQVDISESFDLQTPDFQIAVGL